METKNVVMLVGRLAADPELKYLDDGTAVANFAVAVNRSTYKPDGSFEDVLDGFFDCELYGRQAESLKETCIKGTGVQLSGSLRQKKFRTKGDQPRTVSKIEVRVSSIAPSFAIPKDAPAIQETPPAQEAPALQPA